MQEERHEPARGATRPPRDRTAADPQLDSRRREPEDDRLGRDREELGWARLGGAGARRRAHPPCPE
jgi:hypothetical protein